MALRIRKTFQKATSGLLVFSIVLGLSPLSAFAASESPRDIGRVSVQSGFKLEPSPSDGSSQVEVAIKIPPGRNGMQPSLTLAYSSRPAREASIFGYGWSINIPYIERRNYMGQEQLYDHPAFFSSLSGDLASTTDSTVFKAKVEDGKFLSYALSGNVWTVTDQQGTVYKFGHASSTQQYDPNDSSHTYKWMLQEVRDTNGNYVSYSYTKDSQQIYPDVITYTGNGSTAGPFDVHFTKELRNDIATSTAEGFEVGTRYRISEIKAEVDDSEVRKYAIAYTTGANGNRSLVSSITESGTDGSTLTLPAVAYDYQDPTKSWTLSAWDIPEYFVNSSYVDQGSRIAEVNGDGLPDFINSREGSNSAIYINNGSGWSLDNSWSLPVSLVDGDVEHPGSLLVDINGDGRIDVAKYMDGATSTIYMNTGSGWALSSSTVPIALADNNGNDNGVRPADVNGDGLPDLVRHISGDGPAGNKVYINNGSTWVQDASWYVPEPTIEGGDKDLGTNIVDINGDGLADIIRRDESVNRVHLNTGQGGWATSTTWTVPIQFMNTGDDLGTRLVEVNGDGLIDIVQAQSASSTDVYINTGEGWTLDTSWVLPQPIVDSVSSVHVDAGTRFADVDGDGLTDILRNKEGGGDLVYLHNGPRPDLLASTTNQYGGITTVIYQSSVESDENPYLPFAIDTVQTITQNDRIGNTWQKTYTYEDGIYYTGNIRDRKFAGFGLITETDDQGFVTKNYFHQGSTTSSTIGEYDDHISKVGKIFRTEVYDGSSNLYSKTINKWDRYDRGDGASFVKLAQTVASTYDGDADHKDKADSFAYNDSFGNVTQSIDWGEVSGSDNGTFTDSGSDKFATSLTYATSTATSTTILLSQETTNDQSGNKVREKKIYYDSLSFGNLDKGNPTKEDQWVAGSTYIDYEKTYNSYGLITEDKDPRDKATNYTYDAKNLYRATTTNPLSQSIERYFDYSSGKTATTTDQNGRVFVSVYDALDRIIEEKQPDLTTPSTPVAKNLYQYTDTGIPRKVQQTSYLSSATSTDSYVYFDGFDRKIEERTEAEGSNYVVKDYTYDNRGLLKYESLPFFGTGTSYTGTTSPAASTLLTRYTYDPLKRVTAVGTNVGTTTSAYDQWTVTTTDAEGNVKDATSDARGNLTQVVEHNGASNYTSLYEYNGSNKLTKITDADGNVRNFTYDGLGRRLTAEDLHDTGDATYGTWTYVYDNAGNLATSTDPKSQTVEYLYDALNRPLSENYTGVAGIEVEYGYDSCTDGKGRLCGATTTAAGTNFAYNALGLPASESKQVDGTTYTTIYSYDRQGNTTSIVYPDSYEVIYGYNAAGQLEGISHKEPGGSYASLVTDFDYGPTSKQTFKALANTVETTYTYDATQLYRLSNISTEFVGGMGGGGRELAFLDELTIDELALPALSEQQPVENVSTVIEGDMLPEEPVIGTSIGADHSEAASTTPTSGKGGEVAGVSTTTEEAALPLVAEEPTVILEEATSTATTTVELFEPHVKEPWDAPHLLLQAPKEKHLGKKEYPDGTVKYAYKTDIDIDTVPAGDQIIDGARASSVELREEDKGRRTKYSRTFKTSDENTFVTEFIAGDPQYYEDDVGKWWLAKYATTTKESYERQTSKQSPGIVEQIVSFFFGTIAHADQSTFYPDASPTSSTFDGYVQKNDSASWATTHDATSGSNSTDASENMLVKTNNPGNYDIARYIVLFNTSSLGTDQVVSAELSLKGISKTNQDNDGDDFVAIVSSNPLQNTSINATDYDQVGDAVDNPTEMHDASQRKDFSALSTAYNTWTFNATGIAHVNTSGVSKFGAREGHDIIDSVSEGKNEWFFYGSESDGNDPKLVVVHQKVPSVPTDLLTEGQTNPTSVTDSTPEFSAIYTDLDTGDLANKFRLQVATSSSFSSGYWDSGMTSMTTTTAGQRSPDISYGGSSLASSTLYYWRIKFWDDDNAEGAWSTSTASFILSSGQTDSDVFQNISYSYDDVGNITQVADISGTGAAKTLALEYDDLYRLTSASTTAASSTPFRQTYAYSAIGNITGWKMNTAATSTYTYGETSYANPHAPTDIGGTSYTYDNNGNVTDAGSWDYAWDYRNRLATSTNGTATTTFGYDYSGERVWKAIGNATTTYVSKFYEVSGATSTAYIWAGDEIVAIVTADGVSTSTEYSHGDHLGSTSVTTNESGEVSSVFDYMPFGSLRIDSSEDFDPAKKFTGHELDRETDLTYAGARYYDQDIGKWISMDTASRDNPGQFLRDPQQLNGYSYARNNPLILFDPTGEKVEIYSKAIEANSLGTHVFLSVTPDNPGDFSGMPSNWTLGAYANDYRNPTTLVKAMDAGSDRSVVDNGYSVSPQVGYMKQRAEVQRPDGITDTEFINRIMGQYNAYGDDAQYDPLARKGYNSNNFVSGLIVNSGAQLPWNGNARGVDPGYGQPIPSNYIKTTGQVVPTGYSTVSSYAGQQGSQASSGAFQSALRSLQSALTKLSKALSSLRR